MLTKDQWDRMDSATNGELKVWEESVNEKIESALRNGQSFSDQVKALNNPTNPDPISRAGENADQDWMKSALEVVHRLCQNHEEFSTDDVHRELEGSGTSTQDGRALGAVLRQAAKKCWCRNTMRVQVSRRSECHRRPIAVWQSLIYSSTSFQ